MNIMFVLLPLAMLAILLVLGALFWAGKVRSSNALRAKNVANQKKTPIADSDKSSNNS